MIMQCVRASSQSPHPPRLVSKRHSMQQHTSAVHRARAVRCAAQAPAKSAVDMQERIEFLKEDLTHLFDDQGLNKSQYDKVVTFRDPISKFNSVQGYMFNISMLKILFSPKFELHDIRQTGKLEATTRWTMTMTFTPAKLLRFTKWDPAIAFTGTSIYGFNPENGKINKHVDTWDSVQNQKFFSFEAVGDFLKQLLQTYTTPKLGTPPYTLLKRTAKFQVRRYRPFVVAETALDSAEQLDSSSNSADSSSSSSKGGFTLNPAGAGMKAFNALAGYIFGGNEAGTKMAMTTPVLSNTAGYMQFVVDPDTPQASTSSLPAPSNSSVRLLQQSGGIYAAAMFNGVATPRKCAEVQQQLLTALQEAGLQPVDASLWTLARYNDPSVRPMFRRNEVLMHLKDFDLWQ